MYAMDGRGAKPELVFCYESRKYNGYGKTVLNWLSEGLAAQAHRFLDLPQDLARAPHHRQHFV